jgi:hypothetical protein
VSWASLKTIRIGISEVIEPEVTAVMAKGSGGGRGLIREQENCSAARAGRNKARAVKAFADRHGFTFIKTPPNTIYPQTGGMASSARGSAIGYPPRRTQSFTEVFVTNPAFFRVFRANCGFFLDTVIAYYKGLAARFPVVRP